MSVNYEYYRVFHAVASYKNITAAAQSLFLSQPGVSRTIQNLEAALGCQLLLRSTHGVKLTQEGQILYQHLDIAVAHISEAEKRLQNIHRLKEGMLHIGVSEATLESFLLPYLEKMKICYPGISIRVSFISPDEVAEKLNTNLLDLAVLVSPLPEDASIRVTKLRQGGDASFQLLSGKAYRELQDEPQDLAYLLENYPFICFKRGTSVRTFADQLSLEVGKVLEPVCEVESAFILRPMIRAGLGLGFVQNVYPDKPMSEEGLYPITLKQEIPRADLCLLTSNAVHSNAANAFIKLLLQT